MHVYPPVTVRIGGGKLKAATTAESVTCTCFRFYYIEWIPARDAKFTLPSLSLARTVRVIGPRCGSLWELFLIGECELNLNDVDPFSLVDCDDLYSMWGAVHNYCIWLGYATASHFGGTTALG